MDWRYIEVSEMIEFIFIYCTMNRFPATGRGSHPVSCACSELGSCPRGSGVRGAQGPGPVPLLLSVSSHHRGRLAFLPAVSGGGAGSAGSAARAPGPLWTSSQEEPVTSSTRHHPETVVQLLLPQQPNCTRIVWSVKVTCRMQDQCTVWLQRSRVLTLFGQASPCVVIRSCGLSEVHLPMQLYSQLINMKPLLCHF